MKLNCIIVDDEPRAINILQEYVEKIPTLHLLATFRNPLKAFDFIKQNDVQLLFLDINMPNLTGIQFIKSLSTKPFIILTTAYSEYAVESYQLDVEDYLLKPIEFERFMISMNKIYDKFKAIKPSSKQITDEQNNSKKLDYIFVKNGTKIVKVNLSDIIYIEGSGNYIQFHLEQGKLLVLGKMGLIIRQLNAMQFARIHKSYIIQISKINAVENNRVNLGKIILPISSTYRTAFYDLLQSDQT